MPEVMVNRRVAPRYAMVLAAEVTELTSRARLNARTSDVSRSGCYIDTLNPMPAGTQIHVRLIRGTESFETHARVVYASPGLGMGVAFQGEPVASQMAILDQWLWEAAQAR
jgi:hypothetical protein